MATNKTRNPATKATSTQATNGATYTIGLDIGYGAVKAIMSGIEPLVFPSVWTVERNFKANRDETLARYPSDYICDPDGAWYFIGDLANKQAGRAGVSKLRGRKANEAENVERVRFAKAAIGKLITAANGEIVHVQIATGLPVDHMAGSADLKAALIGQHRIQTYDRDFIANITSVIVMPQPYGTIYSAMLLPTGKADPCYTSKRTGVIDVGTYTVDFTLDDQGEYIDAESGGVESGISLAHDAIRQLINDQFGQAPRDSDVEEVLRTRCFRSAGKIYNYGDEIQKALEPIVDRILSKMNELWQAGRNVDSILVSGGGASLVIDAIKNNGFGQAVLVENAQLANAIGYLNFATYRQTQG